VTLSSGVPAGGVNPGDLINLSPTVRLDFSEATVNVSQVNGQPTVSADNFVVAAGTASLVAGVAGQTVRVFGWALEIDQGAAAASVIFLEDDTSGARIGALSSNVGSAAVAGYHGGLPLTAGHGLRLNAPILGGGAVARAMAGIRQS
jgi:hypothetical protein